MADNTSSIGGFSTLPWASSMFYVILASSLIGVMGVSLITPVLPELRRIYEVTDAQIGLVITVYSLPGIFVTPIVGYVADRIGRRGVIVPLLILFGISGAGMAFAPSFRTLLLLRFFQGVGATGLVTLAITLIGDVYDGGQRDAVIGFNASMLSVGAALYPLLGGLLADIRWNFPFLFFGMGIFVGLVALIALPKTGGTTQSGMKDYVSQFYRVARHPQAVAIFIAIFLLFFVFYGAIQTAVPLLLDDTFGSSTGEIGLILAMVAVASATVSTQYGWISKFRSAPELIAIGFIAAGISLVGVWLSPSPPFVGVSLLIIGVGFGILMPSIDTTVMTLVSTQLRAGMMGMRTSMIRLGQTLGPISFTYLAGTVFSIPTEGYRYLIITSGSGLCLVGIVVYQFLRHQ